MAKKAGSKSIQHVSPEGKRLGVKLYSGEKVKTGDIIIRQNGSNTNAGPGVSMGSDYTLFANRGGVVKFGKKQGKKIVSVV